MSHVYVVGHIRIKDEQRWAEYRARVPATLAPWGAELVLRGRQAAAFVGTSAHGDIVVIRFPSIGAAQAWFTSAAYQALTVLRQEAADVVLLCYENT